MEGMDVLETHPDNPYREAHQSGNGMIELLECEIIRFEHKVLLLGQSELCEMNGKCYFIQTKNDNFGKYIWGCIPLKEKRLSIGQAFFM